MSDVCSAGARVVDRDSSDNTAVVVNSPPTTADDWYVQGRGMLHEDNPDYPADDAPVVVVFEQTLERYLPYYSGVRPFPLGELHQRGVPHYTFPESRLRAVGSLSPPELQLREITPAPYHVRSFDADANAEFIARIRERGRPRSPPLARVLPRRRGVELINGHKRTWASHVAGLDSIPVRCLYIDRDEAARAWANAHLDGYTAHQQQVALDRLPPAVSQDKRGEFV